MADFTNRYPYTDFHELNLDWFLEEFKKVTDKVGTLEETVQQFTEFVTDYFDNLDVQQEINNKLDQMAADGTLKALIEPWLDDYTAFVSDNLNAQNEEIEVLRARMDTFSHLTSGSTTGDAELMDARIGANGITYPNAGDAIRAQVTDLEHLINSEVNYGVNAYRGCFATSFYVDYGKISYANVATATTRLSNIGTSGGAFDNTYVMTMHEKLHIKVTTGYSIAYVRARWNSPAYTVDPATPFTWHTGESDVAYNSSYPLFFFMVKKNDESTLTPADLPNIVTMETVNDLKDQIDLLNASIGTQVTLPFSMDSMTVDLYKQGFGYVAKYELPKITKANGVNVFISPTGTAGNSGLDVDHPKKTIDAALAVPNVQTVFFLPGTYVNYTHFSTGLTVATPVNFIALGDVTIDNMSTNAPINFTDDAYIYGIHFKHGDSTVKATLNASKSVSFEKCTFSDSDATLWSNGVSISGGHAYMIDCVAYGNAYDGFNYHENGAIPNYCFEIGCTSYDNGHDNLDAPDGQSSNATTTHEGSYIVRVNGNYFACHGGIVADLRASSANYGCKAGGSTVTMVGYESYCSNYWASGAAGLMYLYGCESFGSRYDTARISGATIVSDTVYPNNFAS